MSSFKFVSIIATVVLTAAFSLLATGCSNGMSTTKAAQSDSATFVISESVASESGSYYDN
ncbi:hypothetical protein [Butyrivibrio fibrisolvens]|uniref:Uncharacterized protein n=1 Tax=Butyrivibrio fibrisolvens TaxID=831 RepID=A0A317FZ41_BUTFI|nr:hypothetical protein [Butyrivibrio fibrisolvens]PWT26517.1 hypothetical protein CPT75_04965 [Butyrivibrio fibrisolvens]